MNNKARQEQETQGIRETAIKKTRRVNEIQTKEKNDSNLAPTQTAVFF